MYLHWGDREKLGGGGGMHKRNVKTLEETYNRSSKKDSLVEMHPSTIMDQAGKENHTIDWEGLTFPVRDTDWSARVVTKAVEIRKTGAHSMNRDVGHNQLPEIYS